MYVSYMTSTTHESMLKKAGMGHSASPLSHPATKTQVQGTSHDTHGERYGGQGPMGRFDLEKTSEVKVILGQKPCWLMKNMVI